MKRVIEKLLFSIGGIMEKFLLVDGNSLLFRAYYATAFGRILQTSYGKYTNAITAFDRMLMNVIEEVQPDHLLIAFDTGAKTFRHEMFDDYKGHRSKAPEELVEQFETIREYIDCANIKRIEVSGFEADDLIGSYAKQIKDMKMIVLTSDQDMLQLVDDNIEVFLMKKGVSQMERVTSDNFMELYGIEPLQIIDLKAMMGDTADNIPGIPGIGKVTANKLVQAYGSLENLHANIDQLKGKQKENVENNIEIAQMSKTLATIKVDIDIDTTADVYKTNIDYGVLYNFYRTYEMRKQAEAISEMLYTSEEVSSFEYEMVTNISATLLSNDSFIFAHTSKDLENSIKYFIISNEQQTEVITVEDLLNDQALHAYLADDNISKAVYDVKHLYHLFDDIKLELNGVSDDLKLASFLVDNSITNWETFNTRYDGVNFALNNDDVSVQTLAESTHELLHMVHTINEELVEKEMESLYRDIELPLTKVLFDMEKTGIRVDRVIIVDIAQKTKVKIDALSLEIYALAGREFNINSPKQLAEVLFDELALPMIKKRSTAVDVLEKLESEHKIIQLIMQQRKYQKMYSTYAEGLQKYISDKERIHTLYNQTIAATGRLSSTEPNLQNISVRDEEARKIRKAFIADEDSVLMAYDYSQIELRLLAHLAQVESLITAFNEDVDIHEQTAKDVFDLSEVSKKERQLAKAVNFGIIYGISDFGLAEQLGISRKDAKAYIEKYLATYPEIAKYMDDVVAFCEEHGYVTTIMHRRREIPEIKSSNFMVKSFGKRAAMNAPIQGSAADLIKIAMNRIYTRMQALNLKSKMLLQVHDELIFNVKNDEIDIMETLIQDAMSTAMDLSVPLKSDGSKALDWYEL